MLLLKLNLTGLHKSSGNKSRFGWTLGVDQHHSLCSIQIYSPVVQKKTLEELKIILTVVQLIKDKDDIWVWGLDSNKLFTVKSCYSWLSDFFAGKTIRPNVEVLQTCAKYGNVMCLLKWRLLGGH